MTAPETEEEFAEEVSGLSTKQVEHLAEAAKHDLFLMAKGVLGNKDVNPETHGALCRVMQQDDPDKKRRMALMPRFHLKSTVLTVGNSIRKAVKSPTIYRGLIVGETETKGSDFLREIKGHWENPTSLLRILYPQLVPTKLAGPGSDWASLRASLPTKGPFKEATWMALGVGGAATGGHWSHITCDDIIGLEAQRSKAEMLRVNNWLDNIEPLTTNPIEDIIDWVGTRWSRRDAYAHVMRLYGEDILVFRREVVENGAIIFPAKINWKIIAQLMKTPHIYYSQFCNNPLAEGQTDFPQGSVRPYWFGNDRSVVYKDDDGVLQRWPMEQLEVTMRVDPNGGSKTAEDDAAIVVDAVSPLDQIFVLETWSGKDSPSELVDRTFDMYKKWQPRRVGIEQAGQQTTQHYFDKKTKAEKVYINIVTLRPKNRDKIRRIRTAIEPVLASRRLYCLPSQTTLRSQIDFFPDNDLVDELDALAYGAEPEMWRTPDTIEDREEKNEALKLLRNRRNKRTGY